jgi:hypothetical protein
VASRKHFGGQAPIAPGKKGHPQSIKYLCYTAFPYWDNGQSRAASDRNGVWCSWCDWKNISSEYAIHMTACLTIGNREPRTLAALLRRTHGEGMINALLMTRRTFRLCHCRSLLQRYALRILLCQHMRMETRDHTPGSLAGCRRRKHAHLANTKRTPL